MINKVPPVSLVILLQFKIRKKASLTEIIDLHILKIFLKMAFFPLYIIVVLNSLLNFNMM